MPVYDTECAVCGVVERDVVHRSNDPPPPCKCGGATHHVWDQSSPRSHLFHRAWYEHLAPDPIYFDDRGKLRDYCKRNDLLMEQLE